MEAVLPTAGSYVIAVSGGVDSIALLHALHNKNIQTDSKPWKLVVAHLDHGIRQESSEDRQLVQQTAKNLGLPFVYEEARLGAGASEAEARIARYEFLQGVQRASNARAIVTAHHQDDVLETAIMNIMRGTGRKGISSLSSQHNLERPLLDVSKQQLIEYAKDQGLNWNEDSTNNNLDYLRNYIRHRIVPRLDDANRAEMLRLINNMRSANYEIDQLLTNQLHMQSVSGKLDRVWFNLLPHSVAREVMATWLRSNGIREFDSRGLERLVVAAKVAEPGKIYDVLQGVRLYVETDYLALQGPER